MNFCMLYFVMQDEYLQQFILYIILNNYVVVLNKMFYLGEYIRENWNKILNKVEYCLVVLLKEVEMFFGIIGEEKENE